MQLGSADVSFLLLVILKSGISTGFSMFNDIMLSNNKLVRSHDLLVCGVH